MGGALLTGWLERGVEADQVLVVDPFEGALADFADQRLRRVTNVGEVPADLNPGIVVLAIKPQQMDAAMPGLVHLVQADTVFLSIAAGKSLAYFRQHLSDAAAVVRAMPNTPAAVGRGMTVLAGSPTVRERQRAVCGALMAAVGEIAWVEDEGLLDPVTAVSGGGPAYVFLLIECLAQAGVDAGLPAELSMRIARATVAGAGELVQQSSEPADQLRKNVTSPKGTTLEALNVLMAEDGLQPLMSRAIAAATRRSRELAS
jgi:pyrroline-5-carboxylate reductase